MNLRKRGTEPDQAPKQVNKRRRVQKNKQIDDPVPAPNIQESNAVNLGRPGSPSHRLPRAGSHQIPPAQLQPEQLDQNVKARPVLHINPPELPDLPDPSQSEPSDPGSGRSEASTCYSQDVSNYDVESGVDPIGRIDGVDLMKWGEVVGAAEFIRSTSGLEGNWVGIRPLGKGGNGIAGLWEFRDENGQPTKQMVVKEETYSKQDWDQRPIQMVPPEVKAMSRLNKVGCYAIPRLFNYKRYPNHHKHRMYMEFCEFKDLSVLCNRYRGFRQYLPEAFLWDTFYHLVEAAVAMRDGPRKGEWGFEFVHRDIKPGNIFLASENEEKGFPFYPVAKTGDFGLAVMTHPEDDFNPHDYQNAGTEGYYANEQLVSYRHLPREEQERLSSHTNVWAIGVTMFELLTLYAHTDFMLDEEFNRNGYVVDFATLKDPEYSQDLRDLIQDCLHPTPRHRIRLDILRLSINEYRNRIRDKYEQSDDNEKAKFEYESLLYYVKDEINRMPPGNWQPYDRRKRPEPEKFPDTGRIRYPRFRDGPEKDADDLDNEDYGDAYYGDGDDGDDDEAGAPGGMQQKVTVASRRGGRRRERQSVLKNDLANERADDTSIRPHRRARRIPHPQNVIDNDPANKRIDGSGSRPPRRARRGHRPQLRREDAMIQRPDAGARDGNVGGGGWYVRGWDFRNGRLGDLLEGDMLDDGPDGDGRDGDGTDAGSCNMDLEANDPPSPLPPAPAPALQPPPPAQPPTQTPALQPPPPAPAPPPHLAPPPPPAPPAPQPPLQPPALQPPLQPATRTLRNGKIVKYF